MDWSLVLDLVLVLVFVGAIANGYRAGLLRTAAGLIGVVLGAAAAAFVMPWVTALVTAPEWRAPAALGAALLLIGVGASIGGAVGAALGRGAVAVKLGVVDRLLGAVGNLVVTVFVVMLVASGVSAMGVPVLSPAIAGSRVLSTVDALTPEPTQRFLAEVRSAAVGEALPWLVDVLEVPEAAPQVPSGSVDDPEITAAAASVVRITGTAFECGVSMSGSGFVIAPDRIVTNAHVVAGVDEPVVETPGLAARSGRVVAYDAGLDLAVIAVDGLGADALPIADPAAGSEIAVAGYPFGGPLELRPGSVMSVGPVTFLEDDGSSTRDVMTLAADVDHGNSGGPVITGDGAVGGVVFAKSESVENVGFAIPVSTLTAFAGDAGSLDRAVDSGTCTTG
ncbi:S1-C subfamily serine protease [Agromyces terreus]|uniref:S1-C subfamily serine protease n=1 Tax=Agromyces terreus TaxID=424795 RepID=A0A9X2H4P7_9MICO|nr:MarP family serine protease [Agromyces terreus]MCP2369374.1 S1-C subfamily serine protease [Agromyces terreus]